MPPPALAGDDPMVRAGKFHFSTDRCPGLDPADAVRAVSGPVEIRSVDGTAPRFEIVGVTLPTVTVATQSWTPVAMRKAALVDNDDIVVSVTDPGGGRLHIASGPHEEMVDGGDVVAVSADRDYRGALPEPARWHVVRVSRAAMDPLLDRNASLTLTRIPHAVPAVALLRHYVDGLVRDGGLDVAGVEAVVADHLRDLAALVVGASRDGRQMALAGGVMGGRLEAAKRLVAENLLSPSLSDAAIAKAMRISPSYVRKMFVADGGFCAYVTRQRLAHAYHLLTNPTHGQLKIIDIAYTCGFSSLSTFNRQFKIHYGAAPSDIRPFAEARPGGASRRSTAADGGSGWEERRAAPAEAAAGGQRWATR